MVGTLEEEPGDQRVVKRRAPRRPVDGVRVRGLGPGRVVLVVVAQICPVRLRRDGGVDDIAQVGGDRPQPAGLHHGGPALAEFLGDPVGRRIDPGGQRGFLERRQQLPHPGKLHHERLAEGTETGDHGARRGVFERRHVTTHKFAGRQLVQVEKVGAGNVLGGWAAPLVATPFPAITAGGGDW